MNLIKKYLRNLNRLGYNPSFFLYKNIHRDTVNLFTYNINVIQLLLYDRKEDNCEKHR